MSFPLPLSLPPMEAELRKELPEGDEWVYEPKWDGFRCLAFRDGREVELRSKAGKSLGRYFPDVVAALLDLRSAHFVVDGELVIPIGKELSFNELQLRLHPAASRVKKLADAHPALFILFDLLADDSGSLIGESLALRREALERFVARNEIGSGAIRLSPRVAGRGIAQEWLQRGRRGLDGVVAKRQDMTYQAGNRKGMVKVKRLRTAECVVGGFRWETGSRRIGSLLLGLYDGDGDLQHVGFCSALSEPIRKEARTLLMPLRGGAGFTGGGPQGQSRWSTGGERSWEAVRPELVVEIEYDHFTGGRFRHGTRFLRWRPDKSADACTLSQVEREASAALKLL